MRIFSVSLISDSFEVLGAVRVLEDCRDNCYTKGWAFFCWTCEWFVICPLRMLLDLFRKVIISFRLCTSVISLNHLDRKIIQWETVIKQGRISENDSQSITKVLYFMLLFNTLNHPSVLCQEAVFYTK